MTFKNKLICVLKAIPTIVTFRRYYRCDECGKLHRFTGDEFSAYGGIWRKFIFVNNECGRKMIERVQDMLWGAASRKIMQDALERMKESNAEDERT